MKCKQCGAEFESKLATKIYCSKECKRKHHQHQCYLRRKAKLQALTNELTEYKKKVAEKSEEMKCKS